MVPALTGPPERVAPSVRLAAWPGGFAVTNDDGIWTVRTRCGVERGRSAGPGYISELVTTDGHVLVNDSRRQRGTLNDPAFGGLGAFGWHHARGRAGRLRFNAGNAWEISGRVCARRNHGFGVVRTRVTEQPVTRDGAVTFAVAVDFADGYTFPKPLLRATYRYRFERSVVKSWVEVTPLCPRGRCGRTRLAAFVKEPKLVAHVTGGRFTRMATFAEDGSLVCVYVGAGPAQGPILKTGQCDAPGRTRLQLDYGSAVSQLEGGCESRPCLNIVMRSYEGRHGGPTGAWGEGGLDDWALSAAARPAAFRRDTPSGDGLVWGCHSLSTADERVRRWETAARRGPRGRYTAAGGLFPAWEGGRGGYDCEPLARTFGPAGERFRVFASYSVGEGWEDLD